MLSQNQTQKSKPGSVSFAFHSSALFLTKNLPLHLPRVAESNDLILKSQSVRDQIIKQSYVRLPVVHSSYPRFVIYANDIYSIKTQVHPPQSAPYSSLREAPSREACISCWNLFGKICSVPVNENPLQQILVANVREQDSFLLLPAEARLQDNNALKPLLCTCKHQPASHPLKYKEQVISLRILQQVEQVIRKNDFFFTTNHELLHSTQDIQVNQAQDLSQCLILLPHQAIINKKIITPFPSEKAD